MSQGLRDVLTNTTEQTQKKKFKLAAKEASLKERLPLKFVAVCCSVLQCVTVCCSLQCVAMKLAAKKASLKKKVMPQDYCIVSQCVAVCRSGLRHFAVFCSVLPCN